MDLRTKIREQQLRDKIQVIGAVRHQSPIREEEGKIEKSAFDEFEPAENDIEKSDMSATGAVASMTAPEGNKIQKAWTEDEKKEKIAKVMKEFSEGKLKSGSGEVVTDKDQALAIAYSYFEKSEDATNAE
jgi:hypothetical protein